MIVGNANESRNVVRRGSRCGAVVVVGAVNVWSTVNCRPAVLTDYEYCNGVVGGEGFLRQPPPNILHYHAAAANVITLLQQGLEALSPRQLEEKNHWCLCTLIDVSRGPNTNQPYYSCCTRKRMTCRTIQPEENHGATTRTMSCTGWRKSSRRRCCRRRTREFSRYRGISNNSLVGVIHVNAGVPVFSAHTTVVLL